MAIVITVLLKKINKYDKINKQTNKQTDKSVVYVGEEEKTFLHPLRFFSWRPANQTDRRQINKRKKPDLIMYVCMGVHKEMIQEGI